MTHPTRRLLSSLLAITAIARTWHTVVRGALPTVAAVLETPPKFDADAGGNADADDPAIWVHPKDAASSLALTTLKKGGLDVYDPSGGWCSMWRSTQRRRDRTSTALQQRGPHLRVQGGEQEGGPS